MSALMGGAILTILSAAISGKARATYSDIMGCETGCVVAAAGWPLPYLVDYPGISVVGSAVWSGALLGEDKFHWLPFLGSLLFWTGLAALALHAWRRASAKR